MSKSDMPLCQLWCLVTGLNLAQIFKRFLGQHTLIASTIDCQLSLEYNEPIRTQFRSDSLQILNLKCKFFLCINCLCNKICFRTLCCPLSVQNYHQLKRIHANIVQNPTSRVFPNIWRAVYISYYCFTLFLIFFKNAAMVIIFQKQKQKSYRPVLFDLSRSLLTYR